MSERSDKMLQGCQHSVPIRIPCSGCVEGRIAAGLAEGKRQHMERDRSDYNDAMKGIKESTGQLDAMKIEFNKVVREKKDLLARIDADWKEMLRMKAVISDLSASLTAERAAKIVHRQRIDEDEATA